jgi:hypothetical protein
MVSGPCLFRTDISYWAAFTAVIQRPLVAEIRNFTQNCRNVYSSRHRTAFFKVTAKSCTVATQTAEPRRMKTDQNSHRSTASNAELLTQSNAVGDGEVLPWSWRMQYGDSCENWTSALRTMKWLCFLKKFRGTIFRQVLRKWGIQRGFNRPSEPIRTWDIKTWTNVFSGGVWLFQKRLSHPVPGGGGGENFGKLVCTSYFILHDAQSQVTTRRTTKVTQLKSREMWCSALHQCQHNNSVKHDVPH